MSDLLADRLHDLWQVARAAWPGLEVSAEAFARHVRERLPHGSGLAELEALNTNDLYLACACLLGVAGALERFEEVCLAQVPRFLARLRPSEVMTDEVLQTLREHLFVGNGESPPRIARYHGRGALLAWLRVTTLHTAFELLRTRDARRETALEEHQLVEMVGGDAENDVVRARYSKSFEAAIAGALEQLPRRERNLLRLHLVGGVSTLKLSAVFHVGQATIIRRIAAARRQVRASALERLSEQHGLSASELDSLAGVLLSQLDLSLATCLRSRAG